MKLYTYWRSSAAYRVRIVLNLKAIECTQVPVNLLAGEHKTRAFRDINSAGLVPALELDDGRHLTQSTAIIDWLELRHPSPALLPTDEYELALVKSWAYTIACEIHPLNNIGVTNYLKRELEMNDAQTLSWYYNWFERGFGSLETQVEPGPYCFGAKVTLADVYLVPMIYNALRFNYDMVGLHPRLLGIYEACNKLLAFWDARPENQADAVSSAT